MCRASVQPCTCGAIMVPVGADKPRMTARLIASTSMARYSASRTRTSANGFLPLTLEYSSSGRFWSKPK
ncbi:Uncharacterised protein [Bordetella pertussis]|nr:Uncharacterised protein [Bordetella pertussis]